MRRPIFLVFLLSASGLLQAQQAPQVRLDDSARPIAYDLDLTLDPGRDDFKGRVEIEIEILNPAQTVRLNTHSLTIERVSWRTNGSTVAGGFEVQDEHVTLFGAPQPLDAGRATLSIDFSGSFDLKTTSGIFKLVEGGENYVFTQFEPYAARWCFPSFDEPRFKTPFRVTLRTPTGLGSFSNTPAESTATEGGMTVTRFAESKPLPTYLVAFAVGPFDVVDGGTAGQNDTPLRVLAPKGKARDAQYAAEVTGEILEWLEGYFGIPYPYAKLDSVALPIAFGFGAMENAGLITYNQQLLLGDPDNDSEARQRSYFGVATHELAHQWFGNLVTPVWWDDIWLNEAFASWMTSKGVAAMKPEWGQEAQRVGTRLGIMRQDSLAGARQIRQPVESYGAINNSFDGITYRKGLAVIHMFETWLGEGDFQQGVRQYLKQYSWRNANVNAFLDSLSTASAQNVTRAFGTFLDQNGIPLIAVERRCEGGSTVLSLNQSRALPLGSKASSSRVWKTPVCIRYESAGESTRECRLIETEQAEWNLQGACPELLVPNSGGDGYYQVIYGEGLLAPLIADGGSALSPAERLSVAGDVRAAFEMGRLDASQAMRLVEEFSTDSERSIVGETVALASKIGRLTTEEQKPMWRTWVRDVFGERARALGWLPKDGEDGETRLLRTSLVPFVADGGEDPALLAEAQKLADLWLNDRSAVPSAIVAPVLRSAASVGGVEFIERLQAELAKETDRRRRSRIFGALGGAEQTDAARAALKTVADESIDLRESLSVLQGLGGTRTRSVAVAFVDEHFDDIIRRMPDRGVRSAASTLPSVFGQGCGEEDAAQLEAMLGERVAPYTGGPRAVSETAEALRLCGALREAQSGDVVSYLRSR